MKKSIKLIGIITMLLMIIFSMVACDDSNDDKNGGEWYEGTWNKAPLQLIINGNNYTIKMNSAELYKGTLSFTGNDSSGSFTINVSHIWGDGNWHIATGLSDNGTYTKSGNTLTLIGMTQDALVSGNGAWTK